MNTDEKERLARRNDMSLEACAIRLAAARRTADVSQQDIANALDIRKTAYSNMETARSFPSRKVMSYFYRQHRIDFNFLMNGDFAQLPADLAEQLFPALEDVSNAWDQRQSSDRSQGTPKDAPLRTA